MTDTSSRRSREYDILLKLLTHEWVSADVVIDKATALIPPGEAIRCYAKKSKAAADKTVYSKNYTDSDKVRMGARSMLNGAIHNALNAGQIEVRTLGSRNERELRRNLFTAEYIDQLLSRLNKIDEVTKDPVPEFIAEKSNKELDEVTHLDQLMFDHRTVKRDIQVKHNPNSNQVEMIIKEAVDSEDLTLHLSSIASDWLSDQLGFASLLSRGGKVNPEKAFIPTQTNG